MNVAGRPVSVDVRLAKRVNEELIVAGMGLGLLWVKVGSFHPCPHSSPTPDSL